MRIRGLLLDVEGVLVTDKRYQAVESAADFLRQARAAECPLRLITNNTTDDRPTLHEKLTRAGFDFTLEELHTCTFAAVNHLRELNARRCLVLGNAALRRIFAEAGFEVVDEHEVDAVLVGLDTAFTYERLQLACDAVLSHGAALLALHHNRIYVNAAGRPAPSVGPIVAAIEYATQAEAVVIGKPSRDYYQQALDALGVPPRDVLIVSDDPLTDLVGAKRMGLYAAFVLSGKYADEGVLEQIPANERPDLTVPRLGDLLTLGQVTF
ncbi:MAG: HAD-IIA family hydrolase [Phycisphaerae bacterium]|nr:HAD-IIA family hydrolase [Phycisphaerae bacterium]